MDLLENESADSKINMDPPPRRLSNRVVKSTFDDNFVYNVPRRKHSVLGRRIIKSTVQDCNEYSFPGGPKESVLQQDGEQPFDCCQKNINTAQNEKLSDSTPQVLKTIQETDKNSTPLTEKEVSREKHCVSLIEGNHGTSETRDKDTGQRGQCFLIRGKEWQPRVILKRVTTAEIERYSCPRKVKKGSSQTRVKKDSSQKPVKKDSSQARVKKDSSEARVKKDSSKKSVKRDSTETRVKKDSSQTRVKDDSSQKRVKKVSSQTRVKEDSSQKRIKKDSSQTRVKKESSQKRVKKDSSQTRVKKDSSHKRVKKDSSQTRVKKDSCKKKQVTGLVKDLCSLNRSEGESSQNNSDSRDLALCPVSDELSELLTTDDIDDIDNRDRALCPVTDAELEEFRPPNNNMMGLFRNIRDLAQNENYHVEIFRTRMERVIGDQLYQMMANVLRVYDRNNRRTPLMEVVKAIKCVRVAPPGMLES